MVVVVAIQDLLDLAKFAPVPLPLNLSLNDLQKPPLANQYLTLLLGLLQDLHQQTTEFVRLVLHANFLLVLVHPRGEPVVHRTYVRWKVRPDERLPTFAPFSIIQQLCKLRFQKCNCDLRICLGKQGRDLYLVRETNCVVCSPSCLAPLWVACLEHAECLLKSFTMRLHTSHDLLEFGLARLIGPAGTFEGELSLETCDVIALRCLSSGDGRSGMQRPPVNFQSPWLELWSNKRHHVGCQGLHAPLHFDCGPSPWTLACLLSLDAISDVISHLDHERLQLMGCCGLVNALHDCTID